MTKRYTLPTFFLLTFALTWAMWIPATITKASGGTSVFSPDNPVGQLGRWAPGIAAILLTGLVAGKGGIGALFRPLKIWRVNIGWYAFAMLFQPVLFFAAKLLDSLLGKTYQVTSPLASVSIDAPIIFIVLGVIISAIPGAFMEELGWRGFALPRMQHKTTALTASILLGFVWGVWHIPSMIFFGQTDVLSIALSVINFIPGTIIFTWLFNNTKGSLLLVTLFHASTQYSNNFLGVIPTQTANILVWLVAITIVVLTDVTNFSKTSKRVQLTDN
ncbi:MAG: CPBP family intramembrane glutamic endopeptidase [Chloroflexota bacterium]